MGNTIAIRILHVQLTQKIFVVYLMIVVTLFRECICDNMSYCDGSLLPVDNLPLSEGTTLHQHFGKMSIESWFFSNQIKIESPNDRLLSRA